MGRDQGKGQPLGGGGGVAYLTAERQMGRDQQKMKVTGLRERRNRRVRPLVAPFAARPGGA